MKRMIAVWVMILCLALTGCSALQSKSQESLARWVADHRRPWEKIVSATQPADGSIRFDRTLADQWSSLFRDGRLEDVYWDRETGDYHLRFNGVGEPLEGDQYLIWSKRAMEDFAPRFGDEGTLEEISETRLYRTGIGAGGRGYVLVERLEENWYYVEDNLPT